jgi:hypothetical protein
VVEESEMDSTDPVVVGALLAGLGISVTWLALHGWRQGRRLQEWASGRQLDTRRDGDGDVARRLGAFRRDSCHLHRDFHGVREVVRAGPFTLVRCRETLDLFPWRSGSGPDKTRIAVLFPAREEVETYTILDGDGAPARSISPGVRFADPALSRRIARRLPGPPPHPLSVTLSGGEGIAYLLSPSGAVAPDALDYLWRLGRALSPGFPAGAAAGESRERAAAPAGDAEAPRPRAAGDGAPTDLPGDGTRPHPGPRRRAAAGGR